MNPFRRNLALVLGLIATSALSAQQSEGGSETQKAAEAEEAAKAAAAGVDGTGDSASNNPAYLTNLVHATVSTRPRRLAPGESGTLVVLLVLQNPAVVLSDAGISLEYEAKQGSVELGTFLVAPATIGTLATRFKGTPVHDNAVSIEVPITIGRNVAQGSTRVSLRAKVPLTDGNSGVPMGEGQIPVSGDVAVGRPLPKPAIAEGNSSGGGVAAVGVTPRDDEPEPTRPENVATANATGRAAPTAGEFVTERAADLDRIVLAVDLPSPSALPLGGSYAVTARITVPAGRWLARDGESAAALAVLGLGDGLTAEVGALPEPERRNLGGKDVAVSGGELAVPVVLRAQPDAEPGIRQIGFRLTYLAVGEDGASSELRTLAVPAILPVGTSVTTASPWPFYLVGAVLAVTLLVLILRGTRK